ncbi:hypothetical protein CANARDRAFT_204906 [[Candida] arabinofermentans NRRL YB-2248]|uniref:C2H2-type domain-containing protein n=1 Tax=[Candida] arabinofermentans NRRL YB-2248 TaxID=983967 RepID=A0A1E4SSW5_9ASCO|nr:hypothetical protein CANARDRAFT_204906 [[Candida] arabinofermentans NRRL YB-2248]
MQYQHTRHESNLPSTQLNDQFNQYPTYTHPHNTPQPQPHPPPTSQTTSIQKLQSSSLSPSSSSLSSSSSSSSTYSKPFYLYKFYDSAEQRMEDYKIFPTPYVHNSTLSQSPSNNPYTTRKQLSGDLSSSDTDHSFDEDDIDEEEEEEDEDRQNEGSADLNLRPEIMLLNNVKFKCNYPRCKYEGTFLSKDYLRRHIREQHRRSKTHSCDGILKTGEKAGMPWGCGKKFNRPYQLVNHWRGQRSLKRCGVPQEELVRYGIL